MMSDQIFSYCAFLHRMQMIASRNLLSMLF